MTLDRNVQFSSVSKGSRRVPVGVNVEVNVFLHDSTRLSRLGGPEPYHTARNGSNRHSVRLVGRYLSSRPPNLHTLTFKSLPGLAQTRRQRASLVDTSPTPSAVCRTRGIVP